MVKSKQIELFVNDDGEIINQKEHLLKLSDLKNKMIDTYKDTPLTTLLWSVGGHEVYDYETKIGERIGDGYQNPDESTKMRAANLQSLIDECGGPVTGLSKLCHEAGIKFFPSLRMNEHYEIDINSPTYGRFRRERPDLLIGRPGEKLEKGTLEHGIRTGMDFAYPEVRNHRLSIIAELVENFDVDGIELDWFRHPAFFRVEEAYDNRHLATDLVKKVKDKIDKVILSTGRDVKLAVRVPPTLYDSARIGLDVEEWMKKQLVDIVIAGGGFIPYSTPIDEFVAVAKNSDIKILGCIERLRPTKDDDEVRGIATQYLNKKSDGIYLFNYHSIDTKWKHSMLNEIASLDNLKNSNKKYQIDNFTRRNYFSQLGAAFSNAIPEVQLPLTFDKNDSELDLSISISEPLLEEPNSKINISVSVNVENLPPSHNIHLTINNNLSGFLREIPSEIDSERILLFDGTHIKAHNNVKISLDSRQEIDCNQKPTVTGFSVALDYNN
ncbi:MAG: hypothetical protein FI718_07670 [SAR202 cluster bacterium]|nr:hypothetical protein [SAR202 cluster bacterium]